MPANTRKRSAPAVPHMVAKMHPTGRVTSDEAAPAKKPSVGREPHREKSKR